MPKPLIEWLLAHNPNTPKTRAKEWIVAGRVSVGGEVIRKPHQMIEDPGDTLELGSRYATTLDCGSGWRIHPRVTLIYLDTALAIVNKGPGLLAVSSAPDELSAQSILADFIHGKLRPTDRTLAHKQIPARYRKLQPLPVHRLDQFTSGIFCLAINPDAREKLIDQLKAHTMTREYIAWVEGRFAEPKGTWTNWVELTRDEMRQRVITAAQAKAAGDTAREAITHYEVMREFPQDSGKRIITKLRLRLETGRKHQIRLQAAHAGHPLLGDRAYNPEYHDLRGARIQFDRQALHAEKLSLEHPEKPGTRLSWTAPFPADLCQLENVLAGA